MGAWSDRADLLCVGCERNVVIGSVHLSIDFDAPTSRTSSIFLRRIIGSSLTTSVRVKTHLLRSGRRSRLSIAQSRRRRPSLCRRDFRCPHFALDPCHCITTVSAPNISSVTVDHDDSCELPPLEGGGRPINVAVTQERGPELTRAFPHGHRAYDCRASPRRQNSV
jgi:hypothetical protein